MDDPPTVLRIAIALATIAILIPSSASADVGLASSDIELVRVFYYGTPGDGYLSQRHAASWHRKTPKGWPEVVDTIHYGVATSDWSVPFGTELCLEVTSFPAWAEGEYDELIGNEVCGIVVDRMGSWVESILGPSVDVWPALARELLGEDFERIGTVRARVVGQSSLTYSDIRGGDF